MAKGDVSWFLMGVIIFVVILALSFAVLYFFGGDAGRNISCALGKFLFIGCPARL